MVRPSHVAKGEKRFPSICDLGFRFFVASFGMNVFSVRVPPSGLSGGLQGGVAGWAGGLTCKGS